MRTYINVMVRVTSLLLLAFAGCAGQRAAFRPTERVLAETSAGLAQAVYDLPRAQGRAGEAKLWTDGIYREGERTIAHVGFEIENTGEVPIVLDLAALRLGEVKTASGTRGELVPTKTTGSAEVKPHSVGIIETFFALPDDTQPRDIEEFRVIWSARIGEERHAEFTPFVRIARRDDERQYYVVPFSPFYPYPGFYRYGGYGYPLGLFEDCPLSYRYRLGYRFCPGLYPTYARPHRTVTPSSDGKPVDRPAKPHAEQK